MKLVTSRSAKNSKSVPTSNGFFLDPYVFGRHLIGAPVAALTEEGQLGSFVVPVGLKHGSKIRRFMRSSPK